jgi:cell division protein FtsI (penicillin-binding protein 3)
MGSKHATELLFEELSETEKTKFWARNICDGLDKSDFSSPSNIGSLVPDVVGMGAKDAVFLIEKCGVRACISGTGKVVSQSIAAGTKSQKGNIVYLNLK